MQAQRAVNDIGVYANEVLLYPGEEGTTSMGFRTFACTMDQVKALTVLRVPSSLDSGYA